MVKVKGHPNIYKVASERKNARIDAESGARAKAGVDFKYRYRLMHKGVLYSKTFEKLAHCAEALNALKGELSNGVNVKVYERAEGVTMAEVIDIYALKVSPSKKRKGADYPRGDAPLQKERYILGHISERIGHIPLAKFEASHVQTYIDNRRAQVQETTIRKEFFLLRLVYRHATRNLGLKVREDPFEGIKAPHDSVPIKRVVEIIDEISGKTELDAILEIAGRMHPEMSYLLRLAVTTGWRREDYSKLYLSRLSRSKRCWTILNRKNGKDQDLVLIDSAFKIVDEVLAAFPDRPTGRLFELTKHMISNYWKAARLEASAKYPNSKIMTLRLHDLKRTFVTKFGGEVPLEIIGKAIGNLDYDNLYRTYSQPKTEDLADTLSKAFKG